MSQTTRRTTVLMALVALATGLAVNASTAALADQPARGDSKSAQATLQAALERDLGLSAAQARKLIVDQTKAGKLNDELTTRLGDDFGGSWFDHKSGKLVVAVTKADRAGVATAGGAEVRVVKHSAKELDKIKSELDGIAKPDKGTRSLAGSKLDGATMWSVDPKSNQVVVTAAKGKAGTLGQSLKQYGDAVRLEESDIQPRLAADYLDGGDPFNGCSVGFNVRRGGVGHFLTAGHCGTAGTAASQAGVYIGPFVESWFPGYDDALVRNDNPGYWIQGPWVFAYNGDPNGVYFINGYRDSPVGTAICKSGRTTGLTCGWITVKNETVTYDGWATVYGLTRHSACVEPGDSGGSNFSWSWAGNHAEGVTSGASLIWDGWRWRCGQAFGWPNTSWYFPIAPSIAYYGVTMW